MLIIVPAAFVNWYRKSHQPSSFAGTKCIIHAARPHAGRTYEPSYQAHPGDQGRVHAFTPGRGQGFINATSLLFHYQLSSIVSALLSDTNLSEP